MGQTKASFTQDQDPSKLLLAPALAVLLLAVMVVLAAWGMWRQQQVLHDMSQSQFGASVLAWRKLTLEAVDLASMDANTGLAAMQSADFPAGARPDAARCFSGSGAQGPATAPLRVQCRTQFELVLLNCSICCVT